MCIVFYRTHRIAFVSESHVAVVQTEKKSNGAIVLLAKVSRYGSGIRLGAHRPDHDHSDRGHRVGGRFACVNCCLVWAQCQIIAAREDKVSDSLEMGDYVTRGGGHRGWEGLTV